MEINLYDFDENFMEALENMNIGDHELRRFILTLKEFSFECGYQQAISDIKNGTKK